MPFQKTKNINYISWNYAYYNVPTEFEEQLWFKMNYTHSTKLEGKGVIKRGLSQVHLKYMSKREEEEGSNLLGFP